MATPRTAPGRVQLPERFKHWSAAQARDALAAHTQSGLSLTAFARRERLPLHRLQWWRARLKGLPKQTVTAVRLVPVTIRSRPAPLPAPSLEIDVRGGRVIRATGPFDPVALARLVHALEGEGC